MHYRSKLLVFSNSISPKLYTLDTVHEECTGNSQLHLDISCMVLLYFAASGHYHYQKSVYLYLQTMSQIHVNHPGFYKHFINELHVMRRNNHFWAGLSPDLVIEQVLAYAQPENI